MASLTMSVLLAKELQGGPDAKDRNAGMCATDCSGWELPPACFLPYFLHGPPGQFFTTVISSARAVSV